MKKITQLLTLFFIFNESIHAKSIVDSSKYIAVGRCSGYVLSSDDIQNWNRVNIPTSNYLYGITYGDNKYVAVGDFGTVISSNDGVNWSLQKSLPTTQATYIAYAQNKFLAVGTDGALFVSNDGINWLPLNSLTNKGLFFVGAVKDKYFISGEDGFIGYSKNGIDWNIAKTNLKKETIVSILSDGTQFFAFSTTGKILVSNDGSVWNVSYDLGPDTNVNKAIYADKYFIAIGGKVDWTIKPEPAHYNIFRSKDGNHWEFISVVNKNSINIAEYNGNYILSLPGGILYSQNMLDWLPAFMGFNSCTVQSLVKPKLSI